VLVELIDPHHHLWCVERHPWLSEELGETFFGDPTPIQKNYLIEDFFEDTKNLDVVKSVAIQADYDPSDPAGETRWLQSIADRPGSRGFPHGIVAFANLADPDVEPLLYEHCRYPNIRGIRHILNRHPDPVLNVADRDYLNDDTWRRNFGLLRKYRLSFDLQIYYQQTADAASLAWRHPDTQIILEHTGMPAERDEKALAGWRHGMRTLAQYPNIVVKISGLGMFDRTWTTESIRPFVAETIEVFGIDRCMFASNFPVDKLTSDYDEIWNAFDILTRSFSEDERRKLFHDNARRYYRL